MYGRKRRGSGPTLANPGRELEQNSECPALGGKDVPAPANGGLPHGEGSRSGEAHEKRGRLLRGHEVPLGAVCSVLFAALSWLPGKDRSSSPSGKAPRAPLIAIIVLAAVGMAVMIQLTYTHWAAADPSFASFCPGAGAAGVDCDDVARSEYSELFGVPISFWGLLAYMGIIAVAAWTLRSFRGKAHVGAGLGLLSVTAVGSVVTSVALGYIAHYLIEAVCSWCTAGYVINASIAVAVFTSLWKLRMNPLEALGRDLGFFVQRPAVTASFCGGGAVVAAATLLLYPTPTPVGDGEVELPERIEIGVDGMPDPVREEAPFKGPEDAVVTIVEFTDYQCPICKRASAHMSRVLEPYEGEYRIMHRYFPLDHACNPLVPARPGQHSCQASLYTICAMEQDKFWEMNRLVFGSREPLEEAHLRKLAERAGCDLDLLDECLAADRPEEHLERDIQDGIDLDIKGTPTFFFNGRRVVGLPSEEVVRRIFEEELEGS